MAVRSAGSIGRGLVSLRDAEARAGKAYLAAVGEQKARDAVEVPGLSPAAWDAVRVLEKAGWPEEGTSPAQAFWDRTAGTNHPAIAAVWAREVLGRPGVEAELRAVADAAGRRLGPDGARNQVRSASSAQDGPGQREGLIGVGVSCQPLAKGSGRMPACRTGPPSSSDRLSERVSGCGKGRGSGGEMRR